MLQLTYNMIINAVHSFFPQVRVRNLNIINIIKKKKKSKKKNEIIANILKTRKNKKIQKIFLKF